MEREIIAAQTVVAFVELHQRTLDRLATCARSISPASASLSLSGSFARSEATGLIVGSPVSTIVVGLDEVPALLGGGTGPWRAIAKEGSVLVGMPVTSSVEKA